MSSLCELNVISLWPRSMSSKWSRGDLFVSLLCELTMGSEVTLLDHCDLTVSLM